MAGPGGVLDKPTKFLNEKEFADGLLYTGKRMFGVFQRIFEKYEREFSEDEEGGLDVSLTDFPSISEDSFNNTSDFSDANVTDVEIPAPLIENPQNSTNFEDDAAALYEKFVKVKKEFQMESDNEQDHEITSGPESDYDGSDFQCICDSCACRHNQMQYPIQPYPFPDVQYYPLAGHATNFNYNSDTDNESIISGPGSYQL